MADLVLPAATAVVAGEADALAAFTEEWLRNRRLSDHTRAAYRRDVAMWASWCAEQGIAPLAAKFVHVNEWGRQLEQPHPETGKAAAVSTVARRMSAVSSWYRFLVKLGAIAVNPAAGADRPRVDRDHSPTVGFTAAEGTAMLTAAAIGDRYLGTAARPVLDFLVDLGVRVSEVCALDVEDLGHDSGHRTAQFQMKGGKVRVRSLPPSVANNLDRYLAGRAHRAGVPVGQLAGALFITPAGQRLDRHEVYRFVRRMAKAAGMPNWQKITPHSFRHAWNAIARERGAELEDRQDAMGHKDPRTTRRYDRNRRSLDRDPSFLVAAATSTAD